MSEMIAANNGAIAQEKDQRNLFVTTSCIACGREIALNFIPEENNCEMASHINELTEVVCEGSGNVYRLQAVKVGGR